MLGVFMGAVMSARTYRGMLGVQGELVRVWDTCGNSESG